MRISDCSSDVCSSDLAGAQDKLPAMPEVETPIERKPGPRGISTSLDANGLGGHCVRFRPKSNPSSPPSRHRVGHIRLPARPRIGRPHVCTPVTNAHLLSRLLLEKTNTTPNHTHQHI